MFDSKQAQAIKTMLELQDGMNSKVHPQWIEQQFAWYRAAWIECAELMDHYGYKWWKQQHCDLEQVQLEVIDIWHFGMSAMFTPGVSHEQLAEDIVASLKGWAPQRDDVLSATEALAAHCLNEHGFSVPLFWDLMTASGLSFDDLYRQYVGKNVLNFFRQDNGYKEGTYKKLWQGREDNTHLVEILNELDAGATDFADNVYKALGERYAGA